MIEKLYRMILAVIVMVFLAACYNNGAASQTVQSTQTNQVPVVVEKVEPIKATASPINQNDVEFCKDKTLSSISKEIADTDSCCLSKYLVSKYGVSDYKHSKEFKFNVCGTAIYDCYSSKNDKYFIKNIPNVDKQGNFYFGLKWNKEASRLVHSLGWCESGYVPTITSPDGGYGIFQITPDAIGDKSINTSMLLTSEYNTQYGIYHLNKFWKSANDKYEEYNSINSDNFIQYLSLRGYNGGFKQIDRIFEKEDDPLNDVFSGNYIESSKISGRFVCFEKVNQIYPLKIYKTSETLKSKAF